MGVVGVGVGRGGRRRRCVMRTAFCSVGRRWGVRAFGAPRGALYDWCHETVDSYVLVSASLTSCSFMNESLPPPRPRR